MLMWRILCDDWSVKLQKEKFKVKKKYDYKPEMIMSHLLNVVVLYLARN